MRAILAANWPTLTALSYALLVGVIVNLGAQLLSAPH